MRARCCAIARRNSAASDVESKISSASSPASGLHKTGTPSSAAMSSAAMAVGELRRGCVAQAAHLDAAARGDFDDAVAMRSRRSAQRGEGGERNGADRQKPHQQAVAGRHRRRQSRGRRRGAAERSWRSPSCHHLRAQRRKAGRRCRCGADARNRGGARHRASRRSLPRLRDFRAAESRAPRDRRHRRRKRDRTIRR